MICGTDGGSYLGPGLTLRQEFKELSDAGLSPLTILQMATVNAAAYLGRADSMGTIESGKDADLVLLDADPLARVENLHAIAGVVVSTTRASGSTRCARRLRRRTVISTPAATQRPRQHTARAARGICIDRLAP